MDSLTLANKYKDGDIVWVKLGHLWWPGEVLGSARQTADVKKTRSSYRKSTIAVVKFFQENTVYYVKNIAEICSYECHRKNEFIQKGLALVPTKIELEHFPADVVTAERRTNGDPDIINKLIDDDNYPSLPQTPKKIVTPEQPVKRGRGRPRLTPKSSPVQSATHTVRVLGDTTPTRTLQQPRPPADDSPAYNCSICGFTTRRLNIIVMHSKNHPKVDQVTPIRSKESVVKSPAISVPPKSPQRIVRPSSPSPRPVIPSIVDVDSDSDIDQLISPIIIETERRQTVSILKNRNEPPSKPMIVPEVPVAREPSKLPELKNSILADWNDSSSESEADVNPRPIVRKENGSGRRQRTPIPPRTHPKKDRRCIEAFYRTEQPCTSKVTAPTAIIVLDESDEEPTGNVDDTVTGMSRLDDSDEVSFVMETRFDKEGRRSTSVDGIVFIRSDGEKGNERVDDRVNPTGQPVESLDNQLEISDKTIESDRVAITDGELYDQLDVVEIQETDDDKPEKNTQNEQIDREIEANLEKIFQENGTTDDQEQQRDIVVAEPEPVEPLKIDQIEGIVTSPKPASPSPTKPADTGDCFDFNEDEDMEPLANLLNRPKRRSFPPKLVDLEPIAKIKEQWEHDARESDRQSSIDYDQLNSDVSKLLTELEPVKIPDIPTARSDKSNELDAIDASPSRDGPVPPKERGKIIFKSRNRNVNDSVDKSPRKSESDGSPAPSPKDNVRKTSIVIDEDEKFDGETIEQVEIEEESVERQQIEEDLIGKQSVEVETIEESMQEEESIVNEPVTEESSLRETIEKECMDEQQQFEEESTEQQPIEERALEQQSIEEKSDEQPPIEEKSGEQDEESVVQQPYEEEPVVQQLNEEESVIQHPIEEDSVIQPQVEVESVVHQEIEEESAVQQQIDQPSVVQQDIEEESVIQPQIEVESVVQQEFEEESVVQQDIAVESVVQQEFEEEPVVQQQIEVESVVQQEIEEETVVPQQIEDKSVVQQEIEDESVVQQEIEDESIVQQEFEEESVVKQQGIGEEPIVQQHIEEKLMPEQNIEDESMEQQAIEERLDENQPIQEIIDDKSIAEQEIEGQTVEQLSIENQSSVDYQLIEQLSTENDSIHQSPIQDQVNEQRSAEDELTDKVTTEKDSFDRSAYEQPSVEDEFIDQESVEDDSVQQPPIGDQIVDQPSVHEHLMDQELDDDDSIGDEEDPLIVDCRFEEDSVEQLPVDDHLIEQSPTGDQIIEQPSVDDDLIEPETVENHSIEGDSVEKSPTEDQSIVIIEELSVEDQSIEAVKDQLIEQLSVEEDSPVGDQLIEQLSDDEEQRIEESLEDSIIVHLPVHEKPIDEPIEQSVDQQPTEYDLQIAETLLNLPNLHSTISNTAVTDDRDSTADKITENTSESSSTSDHGVELKDDKPITPKRHFEEVEHQSDTPNPLPSETISMAINLSKEFNEIPAKILKISKQYFDQPVGSPSVVEESSVESGVSKQQTVVSRTEPPKLIEINPLAGKISDKSFNKDSYLPDNARFQSNYKVNPPVPPLHIPLFSKRLSPIDFEMSLKRKQSCELDEIPAFVIQKSTHQPIVESIEPTNASNQQTPKPPPLKSRKKSTHRAVEPAATRSIEPATRPVESISQRIVLSTGPTAAEAVGQLANVLNKHNPNQIDPSAYNAKVLINNQVQTIDRAALQVNTITQSCNMATGFGQTGVVGLAQNLIQQQQLQQMKPIIRTKRPPPRGRIISQKEVGTDGKGNPVIKYIRADEEWPEKRRTTTTTQPTAQCSKYSTTVVQPGQSQPQTIEYNYNLSPSRTKTITYPPHLEIKLVQDPQQLTQQQSPPPLHMPKTKQIDEAVKLAQSNPNLQVTKRSLISMTEQQINDMKQLGFIEESNGVQVLTADGIQYFVEEQEKLIAAGQQKIPTATIPPYTPEPIVGQPVRSKSNRTKSTKKPRKSKGELKSEMQVRSFIEPPSESTDSTEPNQTVYQSEDGSFFVVATNEEGDTIIQPVIRTGNNEYAIQTEPCVEQETNGSLAVATISDTDDQRNLIVNREEAVDLYNQMDDVQAQIEQPNEMFVLTEDGNIFQAGSEVLEALHNGSVQLIRMPDGQLVLHTSAMGQDQLQLINVTENQDILKAALEESDLQTQFTDVSGTAQYTDMDVQSTDQIDAIENLNITQLESKLAASTLATSSTKTIVSSKVYHSTDSDQLSITTAPTIAQNLEESLAVLGVTSSHSRIPISLDLPITITNPSIAPSVKTTMPQTFPNIYSHEPFYIDRSTSSDFTSTTDHCFVNNVCYDQSIRLTDSSTAIETNSPPHDIDPNAEIVPVTPESLSQTGDITGFGSDNSDDSIPLQPVLKYPSTDYNSHYQQQFFLQQSPNLNEVSHEEYVPQYSIECEQSDEIIDDSAAEVNDNGYMSR